MYAFSCLPYAYGCATGTINGYVFRIFQEPNTDSKNGTDEEYCAYLVIKDENSKGDLWPAFYDKRDLKLWYNSKTK